MRPITLYIFLVVTILSYSSIFAQNNTSTIDLTITNIRNNTGNVIISIYKSEADFDERIFYKKLYLTLNAYVGDMQFGVKDNGHTLFNSQDLYKSGYGLRVGYNIRAYFSINVSYNINNLRETDMPKDSSNSVAILSVYRSF